MKLIVCAEDPETAQNVHGGFDWTVISNHRDTRGFPVYDRALQEAFASEEWALLCAQQRIDEGYWVSVYKYVAFSVGR